MFEASNIRFSNEVQVMVLVYLKANIYLDILQISVITCKFDIFMYRIS